LDFGVAKLIMPQLLDTFHTRFVFGRRVRILAEQLSRKIPTGARVLDVGCGDGQISARIMELRGDVSVTGIDVMLRPERHIPVAQFDGTTIPFEASSFDVVMFVDVLHHTSNPAALLEEAARVSKKYILLKDHLRSGILGGLILRFMDWVGNAHHGVVLPYNYLAESEWQRIYEALALRQVSVETELRLYPQPADLVFGRNLHFIALLEKC
jgi:ubiquinone/menaquinone biosynthesis C-methylase UbiE